MLRAVLLTLPLMCVAIAQDTRGTIVGRVTDATGSVVAGAEIRAQNTDTGVQAVAKSNNAGNFVLPYLLPGPYTVSGEMAGFKRFVRDGIELRLNDTVEVNIELSVGNVSEAVEVKAETPLLSTVESSRTSDRPAPHSGFTEFRRQPDDLGAVGARSDKLHRHAAGQSRLVLNQQEFAVLNGWRRNVQQ
jgi:hypothetical protein